MKNYNCTHLKIHESLSVSSCFTSHQKFYKKTLAGAIDQQKQVINIKEYSMVGDQEDEQENGKASETWKSDAFRSNALTDENVLDLDHKRAMWQLQVFRDEKLHQTAKLILIGWSLFAKIDPKLSEERGEPVLVIEPVPSAIFGDNGISMPTYYRHLEAVENCQYVKNIGNFKYEAGNRKINGIRFELIKLNERIEKI